MSEDGTECKDIGANYILTEEQCKRAADSLQLTWKWSLTNSRPKGCYKAPNGNVHFNKATQSGSDLQHQNSICLKGILLSCFNRYSAKIQNIVATSISIHTYCICTCILVMCPSDWITIGDACFSPPRKTHEWIDSQTDSNTYCETNCDPIKKLCTDDEAILATKDETQAWLDNGGDRLGMLYGLTSTMRCNKHWFIHDGSGYWRAGCCHHQNRFFVCTKKAG